MSTCITEICPLSPEGQAPPERLYRLARRGVSKVADHLADQCGGKRGNHTLGATVAGRRYALERRGDLGDPHVISSCPWGGTQVSRRKCTLRADRAARAVLAPRVAGLVGRRLRPSAPGTRRAFEVAIALSTGYRGTERLGRVSGWQLFRCSGTGRLARSTATRVGIWRPQCPSAARDTTCPIRVRL
jgi:hypothetical protein